MSSLLPLLHLGCPAPSPLQKANIDPNPCGLRLSATPSCLGVMDAEEERLAAELKSYQQVSNSVYPAQGNEQSAATRW